MKRIICILAAALCLALLTACGSKASPQQLVGTWTSTPANPGGSDIRITFEEDGTFRSTKSLGDFSETVDGQYTLDDDQTLTMHYNEGGYDDDVFQHSRDAMDGSGVCWYVEGDVLYIGGAALRRG